LPTVGETNVEKIIANFNENKKAAEGVRLFTFGVGYDVNTQLLDKLAAENGGTSDYVEPKEDIEIKVGNFFAKVSSPVLTDIQMDWGGAKVDLIYPRKMPDLFKGTQITLIGRYNNPSDLKNVRLRVSGKSGRETRSFVYENLAFPLRSEQNDFLPRLWATRRVGWLVEQIRSNGEQKELRDEIVELGTRYGIVTPYTSYLATDGSDARNSTPSGVFTGRRNESSKTANRVMVAPKMETQSGADAVRMSKQQNSMQANSMAVAKDDEDSIFVNSAVAQQVNNKTFYNQAGNVWQDAELKPETKLPEVKVQFASEEYFNLIKQEKELAQYFALGEEVVVVYKGKIYRVTK
jgi:Ca-activated chloride channel family protein